MIVFLIIQSIAISYNWKLFSSDYRSKIKLEWHEFYEERNNSFYNGNIAGNQRYYILDIVSANSNRRFLSYESRSGSSVFCNNSYNGQGCNIYIVKGNIVQKRVCSFHCSASGYGQHCWIKNQYTELEKNYNIESSYTHFGNSRKGAPICHSYGEVIIKMVNISYCMIHETSGLWLEDMQYNGNVTYTLFSSNNARDDFCLKLSHSSSYKIICCQIINNSVSTYLISANRGTFTFINCTIIKNNATEILYIARTGDFKFFNCMIDCNVPSRFIHSDDKLDSFSFENELIHIGTEGCYPKFSLKYQKTRQIDLTRSLLKNPGSKSHSLFRK